MLTECIQILINAISGLASSIVTNAGSIITTPVIGVYNPVDQANIITSLSLVRFISSFKAISVSS
jgi:uncharacterized membrane protein YfcA